MAGIPVFNVKYLIRGKNKLVQSHYWKTQKKQNCNIQHANQLPIEMENQSTANSPSQILLDMEVASAKLLLVTEAPLTTRPSESTADTAELSLKQVL